MRKKKFIMLIYTGVLLVLLIPYLKNGAKIYNNEKLVNFYFVVLFLVSALNYGLGSDVFGFVGSEGGYYEAYRHINPIYDLKSSDFNKDTWQPGFVVLFSFIKGLSPNYLFYQIFHAFIINLVIIYFIKRNNSHIALCLFFYCVLNYFDYNFEIQRESFCIILGLLMYEILDKNEGYKYYIITIVLAISAFFLLHRSAFVLLLIPLLKRVKLNNAIIFTCFIVNLLIHFIWIRYASALSVVIDVISGDVYEGYLTREYQGSGTLIYYLRIALINVLIPYTCVYISHKSGEKKYIAFAMLSIAFETLADFTFAFHRMYGYFAPFYWLVLADTFVYLSKTILKSYLTRAIVMCCMFYYIMYTYHNIYFVYDSVNQQYVYERYIPYKSVLENGNKY